MIVVRLKSGMGNQMFQYAFGQRLAKELKTSVKYDLSSLLDRSKGSSFVYRNYDLDIFNLELETMHSQGLLEQLAKIKSSRITQFFRNRVKKGRGYYKEPSFEYHGELLDQPKDNFVYEGWFQSYKYLDGLENLRRDFGFSESVLGNSSELLAKIEGTESICLNVRRTDFVTTENLNVTSLDYFNRGVDYMMSQLSAPFIFIFSDDIAWCREHLSFDVPTVIVDHEHKGRKFGNYMQLMSKCKHFIIPNSSFAWWAVWMQSNKDKLVVAPKNWFNDTSIITDDLIPNNWLRM